MARRHTPTLIFCSLLLALLPTNQTPGTGYLARDNVSCSWKDTLITLITNSLWAPLWINMYMYFNIISAKLNLPATLVLHLLNSVTCTCHIHVYTCTPDSSIQKNVSYQ